MQIASIPRDVLKINQQVSGALTRANDLTVKVQDRFEKGSIGARDAKHLAAALDAAKQAYEGVYALGDRNLLNDTFQRYSKHSVRHLTEAVRLLGDGTAPMSADRTRIFEKQLFDAEVSTRLGSQAGERSLANPSPKALLRASESSSGGGSSPSNGMTWVDGVWLDGLGNPARGSGDSWTGPDGESFGWDGSPSRGSDGGGWTGPDGVDYSGVI